MEYSYKFRLYPNREQEKRNHPLITIKKQKKFRLYPNREQEKQILRTLGCCRFVFNHYLAKRKEVYAQDGKTLNYYDCAGDMTQLKKSLAWLREVDATALQSSLRDLDTAFQNFFRRGRNPAIPGSRASTTTGKATRANVSVRTSKFWIMPYSCQNLAM